jgi:hypothetical protein
VGDVCDGRTDSELEERKMESMVETLASRFAYSSEGGTVEMPSLDDCSVALAVVISRYEREREYLQRLRLAVRAAPDGVNLNDLLGLSNELEVLEKGFADRELHLRAKLRLVLRRYIQGER